MKKNRVQNRVKTNLYAQALIDSAKASGGKDEIIQVGKDLETIKYAVLADSSLFRVLTDENLTKSVSEERVLEFVKTSFAGACESMYEILKVMALNGDAYLIAHVVDAYHGLIRKQFNIVIASVTTVVPLDDRLRKLISDKVSGELNCEVSLFEHIDKKIVGGVIISAAGRVLDCSVLTKLKEMHRQLTRFQVAN